MNKRFCLAVTVVFSILFCGMLIFLGWANAANCGDGVGACACGDTLTANYTLSADLNCTNAGPGLWAGANDITLDLGGYTIDGDLTNTTRGVWLSNGTTGVTIQGPGTIQDFKTAGVYGQTVAGDATLSLDLTVQNLTIQNIYDGGVGSSTGIFNIGKGFTATNVTMTNIGTDGIQTAGDDFTITNNNISTVSVDDTNGDCVQVGTHGDNGLISGNTLDHSSKDSKQALIINVGTTAGDTETIVEDNTFIGYDGASTMQTVFIDYESSSAALIFRRNKVYYGNYNLYVTTSKIDVYNNIFYKPTAMGIVFDSGSLANLLYNNNMISGGSGTRGLHINGADDVGVTFKNNIFHGFSDSGDYGVYTNSGTYTESNNLYYDCDTNFQGGSTTNAVTSDPLFTDATGLDFTISASSPAIDAGLDVALRTDYLENPVCEWPDIGAYEYQKTPAYMRFRVDDDAGTSGIGSVADPWDAVADVNAYTFYGSDYVVFDRGDTWREQLTVPSSGSSGSPITFGAYGTGDKPKILQGKAVSTWTSASIIATIEDDFEPDGTASGDWETAQGAADTVVYNSGLASRDFDKVSEVLQETVGSSYFKVDFYYRLDSDSGTTNGHIARLVGSEGGLWNGANGVHLWHSYSSGYLLSLGRGSGISGSTFSISSDTWYHIVFEIDVAADTAKFWVDDDLKSTLSSMGLSGDGNYIRLGNQAYNTGTFHVNVDDVSIYTTDPDSVPENVWEATLADPPLVVTVDDVRGKEESSIGALGVANEWYHDDGNDLLYLYSVADPDTKTVNETDASYCVKINGKSYVTVQDLELNTSAWNVFPIENNSDNITLKNLTVKHGYVNGIDIGNDTGDIANLVIDGCDVSENGNNGIGANDLATASIINNTVHHNGLRYNTSTHGIRVVQGSGDAITNVVIESNHTYENGYFLDGNASGAAEGTVGKGIHIDEVGAGCIVRNNLSYDNLSVGIHSEISDDTEVYYNTVYNNLNCGIALTGWSNYTLDGNKIYNNTMYNNTYGLCAWGSNSENSDQFTNNEFKNNIILGSTSGAIIARWGGENDGTAGSGNVYLNNALGAESSNFIMWGDAVYKSTYDDWETSYGSTTSSVESDPLFTNAAGGDFRLTPTSPARGAGADVWTGEASIESYNGVDVTDAAGVLKSNLKSKIDIGANQGVYVPLFPVFGIFFGDNWVQPQ